MWYSKMFDGIKAGQSRMEIAAALDVPVSAISRAALMMISNHDYRKAAITDEQFAKWFETSLVGLKTFDGDVAIDRTEPLQKNIDSVLASIKKFDAPVELPKLKQHKPYPVDCINCRMNGMFGRCPKHAYADNKAVGCKNFKAR
jgi:hypothetical protein